MIWGRGAENSRIKVFASSRNPTFLPITRGYGGCRAKVSRNDCWRRPEQSVDHLRCLRGANLAELFFVKVHVFGYIWGQNLTFPPFPRNPISPPPPPANPFRAFSSPSPGPPQTSCGIPIHPGGAEIFLPARPPRPKKNSQNTPLSPPPGHDPALCLTLPAKHPPEETRPQTAVISPIFSVTGGKKYSGKPPVSSTQK